MKRNKCDTDQLSSYWPTSAHIRISVSQLENVFFFFQINLNIKRLHIDRTIDQSITQPKNNDPS